MRVLRNLLLALFAVAAVIGGMLLAVALAVAGGLTAAITRALRRAPASAANRRQPRTAAGEVIEVSATEVKPDQLVR